MNSASLRLHPSLALLGLCLTLAARTGSGKPRLLSRVVLAVLLTSTFADTSAFGQAAESAQSLGTQGNLDAEHMVHIIPNNIPIDEMQAVLRTAKQAGFATVVIGFRGGINLDSLVVPARTSVGVDRAYLRQVKAYADDLDLALVPEVKLLSHQEQFFRQAFPSLMYNKTTYNPSSPFAREIVEEVLSELIAILDPVAVHIGHDEIAGITPYSRRVYLSEGEETLPPEMFLESVNHLHSFLAARNVRTWMWGDMLIEHQEAPNMLERNFHGDRLEGYGAALREDIPKDILIFDWHYHDEADFQSISVFQDDGFEVVGVTYKNENNIHSFSESAGRQGAVSMMSTHWDFSQTEDIVELKSTIASTGAAFVSHFTDEQPSPLHLRGVVSGASINLSWDTHDAGNVTYQIARDSTPIEQHAETGFSDPGLQTNTEYLYSVRAVYPGGRSTWEHIRLTTTAIPLNLSGTIKSDTSIEITWDEHETAGDVVYQIARNHTPFESTRETSFFESGLMPDTGYVYSVRAVYEEGASAWEHIPLETTRTPMNVSGVVRSDSSIGLTWDEVDVAGTVMYQIGRDTEAHEQTSAANLEDSGLTAGTEYLYSVRAVYDGGASAWEHIRLQTNP